MRWTCVGRKFFTRHMLPRVRAIFEIVSIRGFQLGCSSIVSPRKLNSLNFSYSFLLFVLLFLIIISSWRTVKCDTATCNFSQFDLKWYFKDKISQRKTNAVNLFSKKTSFDRSWEPNSWTGVCPSCSNRSHWFWNFHEIFFLHFHPDFAEVCLGVQRHCRCCWCIDILRSPGTPFIDMV